jgi:uncharacterized protein (UPF0332 family)
VRYWLEKSAAALASARSELAAGRYDFAVNRGYYACFYAASALFLQEGTTFAKHTGLRGALHRELVKGGRLAPEWGRAFDRLFENRQRGDYLELYEFEQPQVVTLVEGAEGFVAEIQRLLAST